jgi:hydrogenase expression/formation protein HypD
MAGKKSLDLDRFSCDTRLARALIKRVNCLIDRPLSLMEVCGTHTMAISSSGVRKALDPRLRLVSGPGCPVCVTAQEDIDAAIELARTPGLTITTFGDMMRVPGGDMTLHAHTLEQAAAQGADVRVVYSPLDALMLAQANPDRKVVFLGVGFETTAPTVAAAVKTARENRVGNFLVLPMFKTMPNALRAIAEMGVKVDGFILPGHVSTIIGAKPYEFLAREFHKPCCIVGFELLDLLQGILMLLDQLSPAPSSHFALRPLPFAFPSVSSDVCRDMTRSASDRDRVPCRARVEIQYRRTAFAEGNPRALKLIGEVFRAVDANWRGLGCIPASGLEFNPQYQTFDVRRRYPVKVRRARLPKGCRCGDVLLGKIAPNECPLFAQACTPERSLGPCMVSSEGACAAYYKYER